MISPRLSRLLSQLPDPFVAGQGRPGTEEGGTAGPWEDHRVPDGWRASSPVPTAGCLESRLPVRCADHAQIDGHVRPSAFSRCSCLCRSDTCTEQARQELVALVNRGLPNGRTGLPMGPEHAGWSKWKGVRPAKAGMFSGSKSHRGKSQKPRSLGHIRGGNETGEADRQSRPRDGERVTGP